MKNIVIIYDTRSGATRDIALELQRHLRAAEYSVVVTSIDLVMDLGAADTVIIGSPLRFGGFTAPTRRFLKEYAAPLAKLSVYYFATCLYLVRDDGAPRALQPLFVDPSLDRAPMPRAAMNGMDRRHALDYYCSQLLAAAPVRPRAIAFFNGRLDLAKLPFGERLFMRLVTAVSKKQAPGDFVNPVAAAAWAAELDGQSS